MLQTRIPHRLRALATIAFICLTILTVSSRAQDLPRRSCLNTVSFLEASGQSQVPRSEIYNSLRDEAVAGGVCKLDKTCCSGSAELAFKTMTSGDYKQKIQTMLIDALMPCHNHTFLGEFVTFLRASKVNLVSRMRTAFTIYFTPYVTIFDEFYGYLEQGVATGNLCELEEKFTTVSLELFLASYVATSDALGDSDPLPNTKSFRQCFYNFFIDLRGERITTELNGFLRAYNLTMRYVRALKMIENVIEGILDLPLTDQCQSALMKMTYCSQCAGYNGDFLPCQGLCMNTLRGCLVDFADLVGPFQATSSALVEMNRILESYNPWDQITTLNPYFIRMATDTQRDFTNIRNNLFTQCDAQGATNRNRRSSSAAAAAPAHSEARETAKSVRDRRMIAERAAPTPPYASINQSGYCILGAIPLFTTMTENVCGRESISQANANCWTGLTYGSYERTIIDLDRSAQHNNPELVVCTKYSRLRKQIAQLRFITRELNILSGVQPCNSDDEDCVDTVPHTCNYFQFPDSYEYANTSEYIEDPGSGSGSGSEHETFRNEDEEDVCAEGFGGGGVTPTIIVGPDTTDATDTVDTTDTIDTTDITNVGNNDTRIDGSGAARLSSTSLLALVFVAGVSMLMSSYNRWYL